MSATYTFPIATVRPDQLFDGILAQLPGLVALRRDGGTPDAAGLIYSGVTDVRVEFPTDLSAADQQTLAAIVAAHKPIVKIARQIQAVVTDLAALTSQQQSEIWTQFTSGTPPLWQTDAGPLATLLQAWIGTAIDLGLTGAALLKAKVRAVAIYTVDNPAWLVKPAWDTTINVPGDQVA